MSNGFLITCLLFLLPLSVALAGPDDPFLWLEEVDGEKALSWVKEQNTRSTGDIEAVKEFKSIQGRSLEILDSEARIPTPAIRGSHVYNLWKDKEHERGIWRRTNLTSYRAAEPAWETVIDVDALVKDEGVSWVFKGATCLPPEYRKCMIALSPGGGDATVVREFDLVTKTFVKDGYRIPEAKTSVAWKDENTLWVASDFGEGTLTTSGYPRMIKEWTRGTSLDESPVIFEGGVEDMTARGYIAHTPVGRYDLIFNHPTFFTAKVYIKLDDRLVRLDIPEDAEVEGVFQDRLLFSLRSDWKVGDRSHGQGSLLAIDFDDLLQGRPAFSTLFEPTETISLNSVGYTADHVLLTTLDNVRGKLYRISLSGDDWVTQEIPLPGIGSVSLTSASDQDDTFFYTYEDFLTPDALFLSQKGKVEKVKSLPAFFDISGMTVTQHEATSKDGTRIPYFLVTPKGFKPDGTAPTVLNGYGGFEVAKVSRYAPLLGSAWIERGGVYALANIRGGGEFGPRWHRAALKDKRIKSFEDFIAVGDDLVARKITSPGHLGIIGGSQGGLLVGGAFTMRPELFKAVVCQVPLLDMKRYHKLLAGASWMAEYGDPDIPEEWAFIKTWSPYHLLKKEATYPKVLFWTNTRDDRVHPAHARKMVARMMEQGHPVYYFEDTEGGHGSGTVNHQRAYVRALEFAYLWKMLK